MSDNPVGRKQENNPMSAPDLKRARPEYFDDITDLRSRWTDEEIVDALERYRFGGMDRDTVMDALGVDYIGTLYELLQVYEIEEAEPDPVEEERQAQVMWLLLDDKEVSPELRQPASWRVRH